MISELKNKLLNIKTILKLSLTLIISLSFILGGIYNHIDLYVRTLGYGENIVGLCFFAILFFANNPVSNFVRL